MSAPVPKADQAPDVFSHTAHNPVPNPPSEPQRLLSSPSDGAMSAFPHGRTHLPTPQSPDYMGQYINLQAPESPLAHTSYLAYSAMGRPVYGMPLQKPIAVSSPQQQTLTPETSPYTPRFDSRYNLASAISPFNPQFPAFATPRAASSSTTLASPATPTRPSFMATPRPPSPGHLNLTPAFLDKLMMADRTQTQHLQGSSRPTSAPIPVHIPDVFSSSTPANPSILSPANPLNGPSTSMERIRQAMMQNHIAQHQEAEARRPEYLKRNKRPLSESDRSLADDEGSRRPGVGIMDSPHKGRRITLFQETSDESFEESLMAGGYGRYRTADWVRQPQPMAPNPAPPGPSTVPKRAEARTPPRPPTEKELRKRKRLEAFRSNETTNTSSDAHTSKLFPVNLATMGRVLIDNVSEENGFASSADASPLKNGGGKRAVAAANKKAKKKTQEPSAREKKMAIAAAALEDATEKPNWPDAEFPWRLRSEERAEITKEEEEQRMQLIEKFLDRDTDAEDGSEEEDEKDGEEEDLLDPSDWGKVYEDGTQQQPIPTRGGRGKMVQLSADPQRSRFFPSDPGDARAALLAKKRVRSLSFRQQRRERVKGADNDEVLCICQGKYDEEGDVVQCDMCGIWYHLHCIGIRSIADLAVESSEDEGETRAPEPTFVPTDDEPARAGHSNNAPLYQPTPPRSSGGVARDFGTPFSSVASGSRHEPFTPSTPHNNSNRRRSSAQIFGHDTPGLGPGFDLDDVPFDPTSTPSRGIKFGAPFATPKNMWPVRPNGLFETPSKRRDSSSRLFGAPGTLDESASSGGVLFSSPFGRMPTYDDSPIRRDTAPAGDAQRTRRLLESPIAPSVGRGGGRYLGHVMALEDSPVMWSTNFKGKERAHEVIEYNCIHMRLLAIVRGRDLAFEEDLYLSRHIYPSSMLSVAPPVWTSAFMTSFQGMRIWPT
ncbi:hypothetical protein K438DRAFT_1864745 [Mycena galopus ATCC 62051]|nr:hypothetical protein K438DRAFT_1864745 [Mycena galopus ATCC 62051]